VFQNCVHACPMFLLTTSGRDNAYFLSLCWRRNAGHCACWSGQVILVPALCCGHPVQFFLLQWVTWFTSHQSRKSSSLVFGIYFPSFTKYLSTISFYHIIALKSNYVMFLWQFVNFFTSFGILTFCMNYSII